MLKVIKIAFLVFASVCIASCNDPNIGLKKQDLIGYWEATVDSRSGYETTFFMKFAKDDTGECLISISVPGYGGAYVEFLFDYIVEYDNAFLKLKQMKSGSQEEMYKAMVNEDNLFVLNLKGVENGELYSAGNREFDEFVMTRVRY